jgi:hypothetical protein
LSDLRSTLKQLDVKGDVMEAFRLIAQAQLTVDALLQLAIDLYEEQCDATALLVVNNLSRNGLDHWAIDALQSHIGALAKLDDLSLAARMRLSRKLSALDAESVAKCRTLLTSRLASDMTRLDAVADAGRILRLLELAKLATPVLANAFPGATVPATQLMIEPAPNPRLLAMPEPPMPSARCPRNVVVAAHDHGPQDGLGLRLIQALTGYGWRAELRCFRTPELVADLAAVRELCLQTKADLLFMVETGLDEGLKQRRCLLAELRARQPNMVIVLFFPDPWNRRRWPALHAAAAMADRVWAPFPSIELWRQGGFEHKLLYFPLPLGRPRPLPPVNGAMRLSFTGTIHAWGWMRNLWLAASREAGIDLHHSLPSAQEAGLSGLDSYDQYLTRLAGSGASVNLTMRIDGTRTLVGRSFEIPWAGALLVEEHNDDIEYYFTPGEHMLTFSTLPELMAIADLIRDRPELVETIRRRGHAFATERYSDTRIIGALDLALWPEGRAGDVPRAVVASSRSAMRGAVS